MGRYNSPVLLPRASSTHHTTVVHGAFVPLVLRVDWQWVVSYAEALLLTCLALCRDVGSNALCYHQDCTHSLSH